MASYRPGLSLVATRPFTSTDKYPFVRFVFWSVAPLSQKPCFTPLIQVFESPEKTKFFGAFLFGAPIKRYGLWGPRKAVRFMGYFFGSPAFLWLRCEGVPYCLSQRKRLRSMHFAERFSGDRPFPCAFEFRFLLRCFVCGGCLNGEAWPSRPFIHLFKHPPWCQNVFLPMLYG